MILYPHGFLDVVLSDDLSRAVHVPLQTADQLSAVYKNTRLVMQHYGDTKQQEDLMQKTADHTF